jgi:hypothetical protein
MEAFPFLWELSLFYGNFPTFVGTFPFNVIRRATCPCLRRLRFCKWGISSSMVSRGVATTILFLKEIHTNSNDIYDRELLANNSPSYLCKHSHFYGNFPFLWKLSHFFWEISLFMRTFPFSWELSHFHGNFPI